MRQRQEVATTANWLKILQCHPLEIFPALHVQNKFLFSKYPCRNIQPPYSPSIKHRPITGYFRTKVENQIRDHHPNWVKAKK